MIEPHKVELTNLKSEIEHLNMVISGVRLSIAYSRNKNQKEKLRQKEAFLMKRLHTLKSKRKQLEKRKTTYVF